MNSNSSIPKQIFAAAAAKNFTEETGMDDFLTRRSVELALAYLNAFLTLAVLIIAMAMYLWKKCIKKKPVTISDVFNPLARHPINNARKVDIAKGALIN